MAVATVASLIKAKHDDRKRAANPVAEPATKTPEYIEE
jgi:hypothetical protein